MIKNRKLLFVLALFSVFFILFSYFVIWKEICSGRLVAKIILPGDDFLVRGDLPIYGDAYGDRFRKFRLEYGKGYAPEKWRLINESGLPAKANLDSGIFDEKDDSVLYGNLGTWETGLSGYQYGGWSERLYGVYTLRLTVFDTFGNKKEDIKTVKVGRVVVNGFGGVVRSPDGRLSLKFERFSLMSPTLLVYVENAVKSALLKCDGKSYKILSPVYEIFPPGEKFLKDVVLEFDLGKNFEGRAGVYYYDFDAESFIYLPSEINGRKIRASLRSFYAPRSVFAVLAPSGESIEKPVLNEKPVYESSVGFNVSGKSFPNAALLFYVDGKEYLTCKADKFGKFFAGPFFLAKRRVKIEAVAVDEYGRRSPFSDEIVAERNAEYISELKLLRPMDGKYENEYKGFVEDGDTVYVEAYAPGGEAGALVASVRSSSDRDGIAITLYGVGMGFYRGKFEVGSSSSLKESRIKCVENLEDICVECGGLSFSMSYLDKIPPKPPEINMFNILFYDDFSGGLGTVSKNAGDMSSELVVVDKGENSFLRVENSINWGSFSTEIYKGEIDLETYPFISFDYKIGNDVKVSLYVKGKKSWYEINLTDEKKKYKRTGVKFGADMRMVCDEKWHTMKINLYELVKRYEPNPKIYEIVMADWDEVGYGKIMAGRNLSGVCYYLDNIRVYSVGNDKEVAVELKNPPDAVSSEIKLYKDGRLCRCCKNVRGGEPVILNIDAGGHYSVFARSVDSAGNYSRYSRADFDSDLKAPSLGSERETYVNEFGELAIPVSDDGEIFPESIEVRIGESLYRYGDGYLFYDKSRNEILLSSDLAADGDIFSSGLKVFLSDYAGNRFDEGYDIDVDKSVITRIFGASLKFSYLPYACGKDGFASFFADTRGNKLVRFMKVAVKDEGGNLIFDKKVYGEYFSFPLKESGKYKLSAEVYTPFGKVPRDFKFDFEFDIDSIVSAPSEILVDDFSNVKSVWFHNAKIFLNDLGGKIFLFSDGFSSIKSKYDGSGRGSVCIEYEIAYSGGRFSYCGYQTKLPNLNLSGFNTLSFYVKREGNGSPNIYLSDGENEAYVRLSDYAEIGGEWELARIPLIEFVKRGVDISSLEEIRVVFEWENMRGKLSLGRLSFSRYEFGNVPGIEALSRIGGGYRIGISGGGKCGLFFYRKGLGEIFIGKGERELSAPAPKRNRFIFLKNGPFRSFCALLKGCGPCGSIVEDFSLDSLIDTWWDIDGTKGIKREIIKNNGKPAMHVSVRKENDTRWTFFAASVRGTGRMFENCKEGILLDAGGICGEGLMLKLENSMGFETELEFRGMREGKLFYKIKDKNFNTLTIRNILFFPYPGRKKSGDFYIGSVTFV